MRYIRHSLYVGAALLMAACGGGGGGGYSTGPTTTPPGGTTTPPGNSGTPTTSGNVTANADAVYPSFAPTTIDLTKGGTVTWTFGSLAHTVTFDPVAGAPADIPASQSAAVSRQFNTAGTFSYHCSIHYGMSGEIIVH